MVQKRKKRHKRIRAKISGTRKMPRMSVFRSSEHMYVQMIDDESGATLVSAKTGEIKASKKEGERKVSEAYQLGKLIAEKALKAEIKEVVFDRGGFMYHGRIKALAEGARSGGLKF